MGAERRMKENKCTVLSHSPPRDCAPFQAENQQVFRSSFYPQGSSLFNANIPKPKGLRWVPRKGEPQREVETRGVHQRLLLSNCRCEHCSLKALRKGATDSRDLGRVSPNSLTVANASFSGKSLDQVRGRSECS